MQDFGRPGQALCHVHRKAPPAPRKAPAPKRTAPTKAPGKVAAKRAPPKRPAPPKRAPSKATASKKTRPAQATKAPAKAPKRAPPKTTAPKRAPPKTTAPKRTAAKKGLSGGPDFSSEIGTAFALVRSGTDMTVSKEASAMISDLVGKVIDRAAEAAQRHREWDAAQLLTDSLPKWMASHAVREVSSREKPQAVFGRAKIRAALKRRMGTSPSAAAVSCASAAAELVCQELLQLASNNARDRSKLGRSPQLTPEDVSEVIDNDDKLRELFPDGSRPRRYARPAVEAQQAVVLPIELARVRPGLGTSQYVPVR